MRGKCKSYFNLLQAEKGVDVVNEILKYSLEGRTVKQNPIMLALAMCARHRDLLTKRRAYEVVPQVCRIPTHLFMFVDLCKTMSSPTTGWGRAHRKAMKKWYTSKEPMKLALDITKFRPHLIVYKLLSIDYQKYINYIHLLQYNSAL